MRKQTEEKYLKKTRRNIDRCRDTPVCTQRSLIKHRTGSHNICEKDL